LLGVKPSVFAWLNFGLTFTLSIFIFYNLFFIFTTTNIWFMRLFNLGDLFSEIINVGRYPVYIFQKSSQAFFTYLLPVAFIATFPVQALLGRASFGRVLWGSLIGLVMFFLSQKFWLFALRHYSSASS
jgi:ABC-2 type transport system permease protein